MTVNPNIQKKANDIRTKTYGKEVRESLASGLEEMSKDIEETKGRQDSVETQFQSVLEETTGKDIVSAPEVLAARVSSDGTNHANLKERLDKEHGQLSAQLAQTDKKVTDLDKRKADQSFVDSQFAQTVKKEEGGVITPVMLSQEIKEQMTGGSVAVVGRDTVLTENIVNRQVTPIKTSFMQKTRNLFSGDYLDKVMAFGIHPDLGDGFYTRDNYDSHRGKLAVIPIEPNKTYTVKIHDKNNFNMLRIGVHSSYPEFSKSDFDKKVDRVILNSTDTSISEYTFTNNDTGKYLLVYVSNIGQTPRLQVEEGNTATEYTLPFVLPEDYIDKALFRRIDSVKQSTSTVLVEDPVKGYPERPDVISVIWVGKNEPIDVEPLDEWRETEGFLYFTDFSEYSLGDTPPDWTSDWINGELSVVNHEGKSALRISQSSLGYFSARYGIVNIDDTSIDSEIYIFGNANNYEPGMTLAALHRASGSVGSESGYGIGVRQDRGLTVSKIVDGVYQTLATAPFDGDLIRPIHLRSRVVDNRILAKVWQDGTKEPKSWTIDIEDFSPILENGFCGIYKYMTNTAYVYKYSVATGGMRAPKRRLS